ncbi:unnamed protein product [Cercopithifilaria johnstoni]|uniref:Uncharacterized protein n=1 Tax=Cercopithifilaria johnstoni TaxID=2874296 RepID=A0A8J2MAZ5_9BILA|nr:unnamed protein product [Cercopithifilaria johnstoni]
MLSHVGEHTVETIKAVKPPGISKYLKISANREIPSSLLPVNRVHNTLNGMNYAWNYGRDVWSSRGIRRFLVDSLLAFNLLWQPRRPNQKLTCTTICASAQYVHI